VNERAPAPDGRRHCGALAAGQTAFYPMRSRPPGTSCTGAALAPALALVLVVVSGAESFLPAATTTAARPTTKAARTEHAID